MPKPPEDQSPRDQYAVVLEDVQGKLKLISEGQETLRHQMEGRFEELESKMGEHFSIVEKVIRETREEVKRLGKHLETHEKTHAL